VSASFLRDCQSTGGKALDQPNRGSTIGQQLATRSTSIPVAGQEIQIVFVTEPDSQTMAKIADAKATGVPPQKT